MILPHSRLQVSVGENAPRGVDIRVIADLNDSICRDGFSAWPSRGLTSLEAESPLMQKTLDLDGFLDKRALR